MLPRCPRRRAGPSNNATAIRGMARKFDTHTKKNGTSEDVPLFLEPAAEATGSNKVLYSPLGGTTILSAPIVTMTKSSRRFFCQQSSL
jgi:hypothetical protein